MSNTAKKGELFLKQVIARLKGDNNEVLAAKISRKGLSAFDGQIAALKARVVDQETSVEDAAEALENAIYPTEMFSDNQYYIRNIVDKQNRLDEAITALEATNKSLAYFNALVAKF